MTEISRVKRCEWTGSDPLYVRYHDQEWGVPQHNDRSLFEFLILEGAQAGLSWLTILKKRENYRKAFSQWNAAKVAKYDESDVGRLLSNEGIVRNQLKIRSSISNARAFQAVQKEFGNFDSYVWNFVSGAPRQNNWRGMKQVPARTPVSDALSKDLQKRGFRFVGSTICYAFMQATGMVNDHLADCFRHEEVAAGNTKSP